MNGRSEKGLIAVAVAFLVILSAMSLLQVIPTDDDVDEGGSEVQQYTETPAFDRIISNNYEPENVEEELDPDGDGEPDHDNDTLEEAGSVDVEEVLDEDGDGEPDYAIIAEPGTPLGNAVNSTEGMDMLDYEMEDVEDMLEENDESIEGDLPTDEDAEEIVEYDPEEDASVYDEEVTETDDIEDFHVLWGEGETDEAREDPDYEATATSKGYSDFTEELAEYDDNTTDTEDYNESTGWSREVYWTYEATDADEDGNPESENALLLIVWSYDGDDDGNAEFTWLWLAGYEGYDNNSNGVHEYEAILVVGMRIWDINDDGTPGRIVEWNWGRVTVNEDEDLNNEETLVFAAYRTSTTIVDTVVRVRKWGKYTLDADDDGINEKESALFVAKNLRFSGEDLKFANHQVWAQEEIDDDDDRQLDEYRAVIIGHVWYDNNTDGNPEYVRGFVGGVEELFGDNLSIRVLVMTSVGIDANGDGNQEMNNTYLWWHQTDYEEYGDRDGNAIYGRIGILAMEYYDNNTNGNPEYISNNAGAIEYWDADKDGNTERNRTGAVGETLTDSDDDGIPEMSERYVWAYENGDTNDDGSAEHVIAAEGREYIYDNDSSGDPEYMYTEAGGYESWDNDTNGVPEYEALFRVENRTWANHTDGVWDGYKNTRFAIYLMDADEDGNPERGAAAAAMDQGVDQNDDGFIDRAWGTRAVMSITDDNSDGNFDYLGVFFGAYDFRIRETEEYEETSENEETNDQVEDLLDSNGDGEADQDEGTITEFVDEELQDEIGEIFDENGDDTPEFSEIGGEPIKDLSEGGDTLTDFEGLNLTTVNNDLTNESSGEPATGELYEEDTKESYGLGDEIYNASQPDVDYRQAVLIDEVDLENDVLWWEGDDPTPDEDWIDVGMVAYGHQLYDNNSDGNAEYRTGYHYQVQMENVQEDGSAEHRRAIIAHNQMWDNDEDNHTEDVVGAMGFLETYDNDTDGFDEYQAAIWIMINQQNVTTDGNPQYNQSFIVGVEQEFAETSEEHPMHMRAVIGTAIVEDDDMDGTPNKGTATAAAMEMYDNDTDGNADYLIVVLFGTEIIDEDDDGNPETNNTWIWILEISDYNSDGEADRIWAVITGIQSWDNDTDGVAEENNAMQAGALKVDEDNDGNDEVLKIYVAGGKVVGDDTDWFVWYHEAHDHDDDGTVDEQMSFALYHKNHTDEQNIITAVHMQEEDHEVLFFGIATTVDADEDGNNEREEGVTWLMETDDGVERGVIWHILKVDADSDGNPEENTTTLIGFQSEDDDGDGTPERQRLLIIRYALYDQNSNGYVENSTSAAIGAYIEGNGTYPSHGYLYLVYGEGHDLQDDGSESNTTLFLGGYEFYNNDTDEEKEWEALKVQAIIWNDENGDTIKDESEKDYSFHFGAEVDRS